MKTNQWKDEPVRNPITRAAVTVGIAGAAMAVLAGCQYTPLVGGTSGANPPAATPTGTPGQWIMPNLVGANLQDAQDRIQGLTGDAIFYTSSHDVSGRGRHQVLDRDWQVCSQNVPAGTQITIGTKIDFGVVKLTESCPK